MRSALLRSRLSAALLTLAALFLTGCGTPLLNETSEFWELSCCGAVLIILDIVALVELAGSSRSVGNRVLWAVIIIFLPYLGCLLYYLFGR